jgi:hypothetical protein
MSISVVIKYGDSGSAAFEDILIGVIPEIVTKIDPGFSGYIGESGWLIPAGKQEKYQGQPYPTDFPSLLTHRLPIFVAQI